MTADHPRPDLLIAAINRRVALLPDGRTGRLLWVNRSGTRVKVVLPEGRHVGIRADKVLIEPGVPGADDDS